ncbi:TetR family transcriptional regulator [Clostridium beijerinckii]|uniref:AcrR family transcriptional regulator n=2 Tax=Clostridium beijerinckii TaxID=1520 RepID=A0AAE5H9H6_CLOBE|nr:TetR/AcrR family transcriptional regulator [Clostridium beijerinckii]NRZ25236.1 AcrR family transcriptional regulator [Clostridium beijerinckii]NSB16946.1 AcrR family transcriptional regulator [Clostridium beijerinckii]NYB99950.1 AcrR family transcriptional regulator [Clostridium beijerinckii]OOM21031.1 fatty acid metabolism regulator protein [Clostridium beijerinckii]OOM22339.1 fatty acid metabolism regulator protein [Clostridium beijerinckii]
MEKKLGRPRSEKTKNAILSAAYDLLLESGFGSVTIEKIAEKAGVSKATIYKWWSNKAAVVMDAFFDAAVVRLPVPDTGSTMDDIIIQVNNLANFLTSREGKVINEIIAEGQSDQKLAETYRTVYFKPRRLDSRYILERGISRGELKEDLDIELVMDLVFGPLFYRLLITGDIVDENFIRNMVICAFNGITKS